MSDHAYTSTTYTRRSVLQLGGAAALVAFGLASCGDDADSSDGPSQPANAGSASAPVTSFTIVADDMAWNLDRIFVPSGTEITATIENKDDGILHNLHVKAPGDPATELERAPVTQTLRFTIDEPGDYEFLCDIHPSMDGTIQVV